LFTFVGASHGHICDSTAFLNSLRTASRTITWTVPSEQIVFCILFQFCFLVSATLRSESSSIDAPLRFSYNFGNCGSADFTAYNSTAVSPRPEVTMEQ